MLIVSYNIQFGCGRDGRVDLARIARTVAAADLILLQEVERHWRPAHGDQAEELARLLPGYRWVHGPAVDLDGSSVAADGRVDNRRRQVGLMILSKAPILSTRRIVLDKVPVRGKIADDAILLEAVIPTANGALRVYDTHLSYLSQRQRQRQVEQIRAFIQSASQRGPVIVGDGVDPQAFKADWVELEPAALPPMPDSAVVMGDFNMTPRSPEYESLVGALDPVYGRQVEADRFADVLTLAGLAENEGITFPASRSKQPKRIDHGFVTADLAGAVKRAWIDEAADGSDHQPVWVELTL
jgi:endonuclease/exonuclease/phosphatase family metal-dependent hydrolase